MERHEPAAYDRLADAIRDGIAAYRDGLRN
jgi:hypothetical protein